MHRRTLLTAALAAGVARASRAASPPAAPVVLELFTSQGCSSCPPADRLLGQLLRRPGVIALAWHIDYWDRLGWRDPFSSHAATERQRAYARNLDDQVYTPALVVGGARMAIGSDAGDIGAAILSIQPARVPVSLSRTAEGLVAEIGPAPLPVRGLLAFYLPEHTTQIGAGENGGRRLSEYRIVRETHELPGWSGAAKFVDLPAPPAGHGAVLLVQSDRLLILGAAELPA